MRLPIFVLLWPQAPARQFGYADGRIRTVVRVAQIGPSCDDVCISATRDFSKTSESTRTGLVLKAIQSVTATKISNVLRGVERGGAPFSTADKLLHGFSLFISLAEVTFASGFPHQFRYGCLLAPGAGVESHPERIIQVKLCPPHDVYTSRGRFAQADPGGGFEDASGLSPSPASGSHRRITPHANTLASANGCSVSESLPTRKWPTPLACACTLQRLRPDDVLEVKNSLRCSRAPAVKREAGEIPAHGDPAM